MGFCIKNCLSERRGFSKNAQQVELRSTKFRKWRTSSSIKNLLEIPIEGTKGG